MSYKYYTYIDGQRYDSSLLSSARFRIRKQGDGRISKADAQDIWRIAMDGGRLTEIEEMTLSYILEHFNFTESAREWIQAELDKEVVQLKSFYKIIDGLKYDRAILEKADELTSGRGDGRISLEDAQLLLPKFSDMGDIRIEEERTYQYLLEKYSWTDKARTWFESNYLPISDELINVNLINYIVRRQFELTRMGIEIDMGEVRRQTLWLRNKIELDLALRSALDNFINSTEQNTLGFFAMQVFGLDSDSSNWKEEVAQKVLELMDTGKLQLLPDEHQVVEDERLYDLPPNGEKIEENWIFLFQTDELSDNLFYAIVPRDGEQAYNYGFN